jgi:hypothetical protein
MVRAAMLVDWKTPEVLSLGNNSVPYQSLATVGLGIAYLYHPTAAAASYLSTIH